MNIRAAALTLLAGLHCVMSAGVRVKGPLGGNASVRCPYTRGSETYPKYFSKTSPSEKIQTVKGNKHITWSKDGRFSLEDDQDKMEFTVTIRNLTVEDAGPYWCGVDCWGRDELTEVNLDVIQISEASSQGFNTHDVSLSHTTSSPLKAREPHQSLAQEEIPHTVTLSYESVHLGASLAAVVLLCGIASIIFTTIKKNNVKRAADPSRRRMCTEPNRDNYTHEEIFPTNTNPPLDIALHDPPMTNQAPHICQHVTEPPSTHSARTPHASSRDSHPESVVYSTINRHIPPSDDATPFTSAEPASLHCTTVNSVQKSCVVSSSSALSGKSCDIYAIIQRPRKIYRTPDGSGELHGDTYEPKPL